MTSALFLPYINEIKAIETKNSTYTHVRAQKHVRACKCSCARTRAHTHTHTHTHTHYMHTHTCMHTYTCTHAHTHTHACTHTHAHTHTHRKDDLFLLGVGELGRTAWLLRVDELSRTTQHRNNDYNNNNVQLSCDHQHPDTFIHITLNTIYTCKLQ